MPQLFPDAVLDHLSQHSAVQPFGFDRIKGCVFQVHAECHWEIPVTHQLAVPVNGKWNDDGRRSRLDQ